MNTISNKQALSEVKNYVAKLGFTFKVNDKKMINGNKCYMLTKRYTDNVIADKYGNDLSNFTLESGYENMLSGYFDQLANDAMKEKISATIIHFLSLDTDAERDNEFIAKVSQYLDDNFNINTAASTYAHDMLCEQLDIFFD